MECAKSLKRAILIILSLCLGSSAIAASKGSISQVSHLRGMTVENDHGEKLGTISDLILDQQGRVTYAVVSSGGFLGIGSTSRIVPPQALSFAPNERESLLLRISPDRWASAPAFQKDQIARLPIRSPDIYSYYGLQGDSSIAAATPPAGAPSPTGRESGERTTAATQQNLASNWIGRGVINRQGESLGKINDLLVNWSGGKASFAILATTAGLQPGNDYAVPTPVFSTDPHRDVLVLDVNRQALQQADRFDAEQWDTQSSSSHVYLYRIHRVRQPAWTY